MVKRNNKTLEMVYIAMFAVIITVCSWISIPATVPFTLQTFGIFFAVGILGGRRGTISVLVYLLLGIIGIPVFSGFKGGIGVIIGNTGGYIVGFLLSAMTMWLMERLFGKKSFVFILSMFLGLIVCYAFGTFWFMKVYSDGEIGVWKALSWCVIPFIGYDIIKIILAFFISKRVSRVIKID